MVWVIKFRNDSITQLSKKPKVELITMAKGQGYTIRDPLCLKLLKYSKSKGLNERL